jgi:hypothetical protein
LLASCARGRDGGTVTAGITPKCNCDYYFTHGKVTPVAAGISETPGSVAEDSFLSALHPKIVVFPSAELRQISSVDSDTASAAFTRAANNQFQGGSLRGLFWALVVEGALVVLSAGAVIAWHAMH